MWFQAALLLLLLSPSRADDPPDIGVPNYDCGGDLMKPSKSKPTNVNSIRPADINVVMAMGDSLTAGNGAGAYNDDPLQVILQYRGLSFQGGGDKTLEQHASIPNILKKFNPKVFGYSNGIGSPNVWEVARLNIAMPGAKATDLPGQARQLVSLLQQHSNDVNMKNDWKLVNIFIGGNDACDYCADPRFYPEVDVPHIQEAIQIFYDNVPKVIVSVTGMLHLEVLRRTEPLHPKCKEFHLNECGCETNKSISDQQLSAYCMQYADLEMGIQTSGQFEREDFTVIVQPFFHDITTPPLTPDGKVNLGFFAPDCFHFSQYGHALVTTWLWKNILEPVGNKTTQGSMTNPAFPLACPDPTCPFIRTPLNSQDCSKYMTPVHL